DIQYCYRHYRDLHSFPTRRSSDLPILIKESINSDEKNRIAKKAVEMIKDNDSILIGSGTTAYAVAIHLNPIERITVITPALKVALELCNKPNIEVLRSEEHTSELQS